MLYQSYKQKLNRLTARFSSIWRFRILILCVIIAIIALIATLLCITGNVYGFTCSSTVCYGDDLQVEASAIFRTPSYQFRTEEGQWTEDRPTQAGSYEVRAVAYGIGGPKYSQPLSFTIVPRQVELTIDENDLVYGESIGVEAALAYDDYIAQFTVDYHLSDGNYSVTQVLAESVLNSDGTDVTGCYEFNFTPCVVAVSPRPITIVVEDASKVYDGTPLTSCVYDITEGTLAEGDELEISFPVSLTTVGEVANTPEFTLTNANGDDVTAYYDVTLSVGQLTVTQCPLLIVSADAQKEYDGEPFSAPAFTLYGENTQLPYGHRAEVVKWTSVTDAGTYNNEISLSIYNASGEDVTYCFNMEILSGLLTVTSRPLIVTTNSNTWFYDGSAHSDTDFVTHGLVTGHSVIVSGYISVTEVTDTSSGPGYVDNVITIEVYDENGRLITQNYDIDYNYGTLRVREIVEVRIYGISKYYDGTPLSFTDDDYVILRQPYDVATVNVHIEGSLTVVGELVPEITVTVCDGYGNDVTSDNKIVIRDEGCILRVYQRVIEVSSISISAVNNGNILIGFDREDSAWVSVGSLVAGHTIEINVTGILLPFEVGPVENTISGVTIYDEYGNDITYCYSIILNPGTLNWL